jgi:hypothetical protein
MPLLSLLTPPNGWRHRSRSVVEWDTPSHLTTDLVDTYDLTADGWRL